MRHVTNGLYYMYEGHVHTHSILVLCIARTQWVVSISRTLDESSMNASCYVWVLCGMYEWHARTIHKSSAYSRTQWVISILRTLDESCMNASCYVWVLCGMYKWHVYTNNIQVLRIFTNSMSHINITNSKRVMYECIAWYVWMASIRLPRGLT